jgi:hypothetical protein
VKLETYDTLNLVIVPLLQQFMNKEIDYEILIQHFKNVEKFVNESINEINDTFRSKISPVKFYIAQ